MKRRKKGRKRVNEKGDRRKKEDSKRGYWSGSCWLKYFATIVMMML
jgi:hypothetical protein